MSGRGGAAGRALGAEREPRQWRRRVSPAAAAPRTPHPAPRTPRGLSGLLTPCTQVPPPGRRQRRREERAGSSAMGPLRETKEQRVQHHEKELSRSRIPRLILRPHLPQQQHKVSPASESPFSEEESREFNHSSSGRSARTISSNSFCSGNDLEALQLHLCILTLDFTIEGQPSLEAPLTNVTKKLLPQQTKGKKTYNNKCHFFKKKNLFSENTKGNWKFFAFRRSFTGKWIWQAGSVKILQRFDLPS